MIQKKGWPLRLKRMGANLALGALLCGLACSIPAAAAQTSPSPSPQSAGASQVGLKFTVTGAIDSVDYAKNTIVINTPSGKMTIAVTPTTAITAHGQIGGVSDLRQGGHVTVSGTQRNGTNTALSITIK